MTIDRFLFEIVLFIHWASLLIFQTSFSLKFNQYLAEGYHEMNHFCVWDERDSGAGGQSTWTFILNQSENQRSMKNLQIVYILFLLRHCLCQNYTQTKNLLEDDSLVLHYGVQDQQFKFKLVGKAEEQIGLAFSYDVSDWSEEWEVVVIITIPGLP